MAITFACFAVSSLLLVSGCKKDDKKDDNNNGGGGETGFVIEAKDVEYSSSKIATVKGLIFIGENETAVGSANYSNKSFKLALPHSVDGITKDISYLFIEGFDSNGKSVGTFFCSAYADSYSLNYRYVKEDMHFTEEFEYVSDYDGYLVKIISDCNYKKGWNIDYTKSVSDDANKTRTYTTTTQKPDDVNFTWTFLENSSSSKMKENNIKVLEMRKRGE
jgi:hypothetical protein